MATHASFPTAQAPAPVAPVNHAWVTYRREAARQYIDWARAHRHPLVNYTHWTNHQNQYLLTVLQAPDQQLAANGLPNSAQRDSAQQMLFQRKNFKAHLTRGRGAGARPSPNYRDIEVDVFLEVAAEIAISRTMNLGAINFQCILQNHKFILFRELDCAVQWLWEKTEADMNRISADDGATAQVQTVSAVQVQAVSAGLASLSVALEHREIALEEEMARVKIQLELLEAETQALQAAQDSLAEETGKQRAERDAFVQQAGHWAKYKEEQESELAKQERRLRNMREEENHFDERKRHWTRYVDARQAEFSKEDDRLAAEWKKVKDAQKKSGSSEESCAKGSGAPKSQDLSSRPAIQASSSKDPRSPFNTTWVDQRTFYYGRP